MKVPFKFPFLAAIENGNKDIDREIEIHVYRWIKEN